MRLWILSDLHTEIAQWSPPAIPNADICIAAGDIAKGAMNSIDWLQETIAPHMPVIATLGNHEFYGSSIERERNLAREYAPRAGVHFLDEDVLELNGIRFIGATLWTDYALFAGDEEAAIIRSMATAENGLNDHHRIRSRDFSSVRFSPTHAKEMHQSSLKFIEGALAVPFGGPSVVVTHHCPHPLSIAERFKADPLTPAFCSDLSQTIERYKPALWIHGHTHTSFDYTVGNTRIVCNPRGYWNENPRFNRALVIETG